MFDPATIDAWDAGDPIRALYKRAIDKSMGGKPDNVCKQMRYYVMAQLAAQAAIQNPYDDVLEFGCWKGHSTLLIADSIQRAGWRGTFHVFDSFEGLSPFGKKDKADRKPADAKRDKYATSVDALRMLVAPYGFVELHKGWMPDVFDGHVRSHEVAFANIDVNLYQPTLDALTYVYPMMAGGGVIFFDDYGYKTCPGATAAIDEFVFAQSNHTMFVALPFGSAFLVMRPSEPL